MKKREKKLHNRGFIILFAMLISSLILLISAGIYNVVQKQVVLSSYARESQKAFYAADAALDCALFNDISPLIVQTAFPLGSTSGYAVQLTCGGGTTNAYKLDSTYTGVEDFDHSFVFRYYGSQDFDGEYIGSGCAYVLVEKKGGGANPIETRITASGFNTCYDATIGVDDDGIDNFNVPDFDDPKLLERRLSLSYTI